MYAFNLDTEVGRHTLYLGHTCSWKPIMYVKRRKLLLFACLPAPSHPEPTSSHLILILHYTVLPSTLRIPFKVESSGSRS